MMSLPQMNVSAIVSRRQMNLADKAMSDANYQFDDSYFLNLLYVCFRV